MFKSRIIKPVSSLEFISLVALMMSVAALSTDAMLPALSEIGKDLGVVNENSNQLIVSVFFLGLALGQIFFGPLSDKTGRRPAVIAGFSLFITGTLISIFSQNFYVMIFSRLLQGLGASGPRTVSISIIRDKYDGRQMARVMSFIMTVFILVPAIAPSLGQAILNISSWHGIFAVILVIAFINVLWFGLRQPETLPAEKRSDFSFFWIVEAVKEILSNRVSLGYTVIIGLVGGSFLSYLMLAPQIFQKQYALGSRFPVYFSFLALFIGGASLTNSKLVMKYGMKIPVFFSVICIIASSLSFLLISIAFNGQPDLYMLIIYLMLTLFCVGILFGNLNAIAMQPLGSIAGVGAAVVGSLSTFIQCLVGMLIGQTYNGTVIPLVAGFALTGIFSFGLMNLIERTPETENINAAAEF